MAKKKDTGSVINDLQKQIDDIDDAIFGKRAELDLLQSRALPDDEHQKKHKVISDSVEELRKKKEELEEKMQVLQLQGGIQEKISHFLPFISVGKDLLAENKELLIKICGILLDAFCDVETGVDSQLAKLSKASAKISFRKFTELKKAGFNENQAMALLLASKIKISDILQIASQSSTMASAKTRTR